MVNDREGKVKDTRIVYGVGCAWWDDISKIGKTPKFASGHSLPCCPICKGLLLEVPDMESWMKNVPSVEQKKPGYGKFLEWLRGKCYKKFDDAIKAYEDENNIKLNWT